MSRNVKRLFVAGGCLIGCGIVLSLVGLACGAKTSVTFRNGSWQVLNWEDDWDDNAYYTMNEVGSSTTSNGKYSYDTGYVKLDAFTDLDVELGAIAIDIVQGDEYALELKYRSNKKISYGVKNGKLTMTQPHFSGNNINGREGTATIYVPAGAKLGEVDIENGLGSVNIQDKEIDKLDLSVGLGSVALDNLTVQDLVIEGGLGSVQADNLVSHKTKVSVGMGSVDLQGDLQGNVKIEGGMGSVKLDTTRPYDYYNYDLEKGMGTIRVNRDGYSLLKNVNENNGAAYTIQIEGGMGEIEVNTEK